MISIYGDRIYKCKICGEEDKSPTSSGICSKCLYKELVSKTNSLCEECNNKCKQTALVSIAKCPDYTPKKLPK